MTGFAVESPGTEIPYSTSVPMIRRALMRSEPNRCARSPVGSLRLLSEWPTAIAAEMTGQRLADVPQRNDLFRGELVEQIRPDRLYMTRRGGLQRGETGVGELAHRAPAVGRAFSPEYPSGLLQPSHRVGEPAARGHRGHRQLRHPQCPIGHLGEPDQDLVVRVRNTCLVLELAVQGVHQESVRGQERTPGALLIVVEPPRVSHVTSGIVEPSMCWVQCQCRSATPHRDNSNLRRCLNEYHRNLECGRWDLGHRPGAL